ncbi:RNA polymerase sigma factor [Aquiflexum gelatinilyticum]|uniref:RNA polymerase sigma factor n=1 Tax=Aquiflexum gelatinilyticum TaxID=2961943 RepID=A0A9X2P6C0_9BACT|nr:sigma-70 family RNA polymerase sigma factor [Aquiflexum gelatinilyticum]MCR9015631.1 sigma-70 family RNA polymerase sigma factor [Aquiflexum gelatinilyticum]MCS4432955.1 sigma-70 family RNA polymerase sigma factor [Aquiflexum gelatinilyticum]
MISISDLELLELIRNPETKEKGYRLLVEMYQKRVYGIIRKMLIIHEDADDITQNTFIKAFKNIENFQGNSSLFTWLYRIATNESLNFLERKKKRYFFSIEDHLETMSGYLDRSGLITGEEIEKRLHKALLKLPDKQRLVFNMRYYEDLSYEQISQITSTSVGALKASYHHAVKKIEIELHTE